MRWRVLQWILSVALLILVDACTSRVPGSGVEFTVSFNAETLDEEVDGRLLLLVSADESGEPRFQVSAGVGGAAVYGIDVESVAPGESMLVDASVFGYPVRSLADLPSGTYRVQAVLHRYETFRLSTGHTVKLPMDRGEGQHWNRAPGNLYSTPKEVRIDLSRGGQVTIELDQVIPPITPPPWGYFVSNAKIRMIPATSLVRKVPFVWKYSSATTSSAGVGYRDRMFR